DALIKKAVASLPGAVLIESHAGDRQTWRSNLNFYRAHPALQTYAVPTLYEIGKKLVESEITEQSLAVFIQ
ncbi:hypothetical protein HK100_011156, partial [Physocladia obscura]